MAKSTYYFELNRVDAFVAEKRMVFYYQEIKKYFMKIKVDMALEEFIKNFVVEATSLRVQRLMHVNGLFGKRLKNTPFLSRQCWESCC